MDFEKFLKGVEGSEYYRDQIVHIERIPARGAVYADLGTPVNEEISCSISKRGIERLYTHQAEAITRLRNGESVVIVTSTASGKTLCYNIPVLESILESPESRALYLFPTKALAQDQMRGLLRFKDDNPALTFMAGTYDGDTPPRSRKRLKDEGNIILTNPDMLHQGILPHHPSWAGFFANLKYVVIDEIHTYRGIFGSNVANVIRRLERICRHYGSDPQYVCCSATIANPLELAVKLTGRDLSLVNNNGAPSGPKSFVFWNPPFIDEGRIERRSSNSEAKNLFVEMVARRIPSIVFVKARVVAELIYRYSQEELERRRPSLANSIRPYRSGYLPEERREIERQLFSGELLGVTSTNALELGIDIGGLDSVIIVGYPGTISSTWQQAGRAGRGGEESLVVFIGNNAPIDQYLMQHPDYFFGNSPEKAVIDPYNPYILMHHLRCAAFESPLHSGDMELFGEYMPSIISILEELGELRKVGNKYFWRRPGYPAEDVKLRSMCENTYTIVDTTAENKVIGTIDEISAFEQVHPEAVYLHDGETYYVEQLDTSQKVAYIKKKDCDYFTQSVTETRVKIENTETEREWGKNRVAFGDLSITSLTFMFKKIKFYDRDSIGFGKIDLPPYTMDTMGMWLMLPLDTIKRVSEWGREASEGLLGIGNIVSSVIPLFAMCDPMDIGTVVDSSNTGVPSLFVYDRYPGGLGFAERSYEVIEELLESALLLVESCGCERGCPSCVGAPIPPHMQLDPDLTTRGKIPDKEAALIILHDILGKEPYIPKIPIAVNQGMVKAVEGYKEAEPMPDGEPLPENVEMRLRKRLSGLRR